MPTPWFRLSYSTALIGLAVAGCFSLTDGRFACGEDGTCPDGFVCAGHACSPVCHNGFEDCAHGDNSLMLKAQCSTDWINSHVEGVSLPGFCTVGQCDVTPCPSGLTCVNAESSDTNDNSMICLDCTSSSQCADGYCCVTANVPSVSTYYGGCVLRSLVTGPASCLP